MAKQSILSAFVTDDEELKTSQIYSEAVERARNRSPEPASSPEDDARRKDSYTLFAEVFLKSERNIAVSLGQYFEHSPVVFHPDNLEAGRAFRAMLQNTVAPSEVHVGRDHELIEANLAGDIVVLGGANSTLLTAIAFEFVGQQFEYHRPEDITDSRDRPIIPLAYYGISDRRIVGEANKVALNDETGKDDDDIAGYNWPVAGVVSDRIQPKYAGLSFPLLLPQFDREVDGRFLPFVASDYLLVTRLPNFLSPSFQYLDPSNWAYLLVFDGMHGIATRGLRLLMEPENIAILEALKNDLQGIDTFQLLFSVGDVLINDRAIHLARSITLLDVVSLDHEPALYATAMEYVIRTLDQMPELRNTQDTPYQSSLTIPQIPRFWKSVGEKSASVHSLHSKRRSPASPPESGGMPGAKQPMPPQPYQPPGQCIRISDRAEQVRAIGVLRDTSEPYCRVAPDLFLFSNNQIADLQQADIDFEYISDAPHPNLP